MTETQSTPNHRAPLAPGEIRTHTVGAQHFQVMHVMNGGMAQASVTEIGKPSRVLKTDAFASVAVRAYADAIEQAESDAVDDLDGDTGPIEPLTAEGEGALRVRSGFALTDECHECETNGQNCWAHGSEERVYGRPVASTPATGPFDQAIAECKHFEEIDRAAVARGESANWWERGTEPSAPAPTHADDVAALRSLIETEMGDFAAARGAGLAILDRIAARAPQRATDPETGAYLCQHDCGHIDGPGAVPTYCYGCSTGSVGTWRALYVLPDGT